MKNKRVLIYNIIKIFVLSTLFCMAVYFENAQGKRLYALSMAFTAYIILGIFRKLFINKKILFNFSFLIDILLVYILEHNSRFLINYFFHSFYIIILLEASLTLKRDKGLIISITAVLVSLIKYILLIYYKRNLANISEMAFFILVNTLILVITNFAHYNREEKEKKELLYKELLNTHKKLKQYADKVEELAVVKERNRIAREIHDSLGYNMTSLIMEMEMTGHMIDEDMDKAKELLNDAKKTAREGLVKIREVINTLRIEDSAKKDIEAIMEMTNEFSKKTGVKIDFRVMGKVIRTSPIIGATLYRIVQESITNAVRHGRASKISIEIGYHDDGISFIISDNGKGSGDIKEGYGIKGMRERVHNLKGSISFEYDKGFTVKGFLPMEVKYD